jgi:nucleoside-diphosphate-sugar epimerase
MGHFLMIKPGDRILVTGANGFIGSHLAEALLGQGYRVRCMVRRSSDLTFIRRLPVEWAHADLGEVDALEEACRDVDAVCHCAALTRALDEETFHRVNANGTEALARASIEASPALRRFVLVSSHTAAGPSQGPDDIIDETHSPQPVTWYGKSKLAAEQAVLSMADQLPVTVVRSAAVFGPRDRDFYTYFRLVKWRLGLKLGGDEIRISIIYVRDLVALLLSALTEEAALGETFFGCGPAETYTALSEAIARALGRQPWWITLPPGILKLIALWSRMQGRVTGKPALLNDQRVKDMEHRYWLCSGAKAQRELGFTPAYGLDSAVKETADWYLENGWL